MRYTLAVALVITFVYTNSFAQKQAPVHIERIEKNIPGGRTVSSDDILSVPELSALFAGDSGRIVVDHIMEAGMRVKGYEKTDLQEGDVVLMANGGKIGSLAGLKSLYDTAAIGSTVKLGVRRNSEMMIVSFVKADPKTLPKVRMAISRGGDDDMFVISQAGLILGEKGKTVVVNDVISNATGDVKGEVQRGDVIVKLNGSALHSLKDLRAQYSKLPVGARIRFSTSHSGKEGSLEFAKPKDEGRVTIRRQVDK